MSKQKLIEETPLEPTPTPEPMPVLTPRESVVSVWDWAYSQRDRVGVETAGAFVRTYGKDSDRPSALAAALVAFTTKEVN